MLGKQVEVRFDELPFKWSPHAIDFINRVYFYLYSYQLEIPQIVWEVMELNKLKAILGFLMFNGKR